MSSLPPLTDDEKWTLRTNAGNSLRAAVYSYAKRAKVHGYTASRVCNEYLCELTERHDAPTLFHWSPEFDSYPEVNP